MAYSFLQIFVQSYLIWPIFEDPVGVHNKIIHSCDVGQLDRKFEIRMLDVVFQDELYAGHLESLKQKSNPENF